MKCSLAPMLQFLFMADPNWCRNSSTAKSAHFRSDKASNHRACCCPACTVPKSRTGLDQAMLLLPVVVVVRTVRIAQSPERCCKVLVLHISFTIRDRTKPKFLYIIFHNFCTKICLIRSQVMIWNLKEGSWTLCELPTSIALISKL